MSTHENNKLFLDIMYGPVNVRQYSTIRMYMHETIKNKTLTRCSLLMSAPMFVVTSLGEPTLSCLNIPNEKQH